MKHLICLITFSLLLHSCTQNVKYEMTNMLPEDVDVTEYVESGDFIPDSCEGRIDKLIKVKPRILKKTYEVELKKKLKNWEISYFKLSNKIKPDSLYNKTVYQYSYFVDTEPVDVYKTKIKVQPNAEMNIFIRLNQKGEIYSGYYENSWVVNNCD